MKPKHSRFLLLFVPGVAMCVAISAQAATPAQHAKPGWPGVQPDGQTLLPNQWRLEPAGKQIDVGDFPVNIALHPRLPFAAVLHCGYGTHEIVVLDLKNLSIVSRTPLTQSFYGLAFDAEGKHLLASGGETELIHQFTFDAGKLKDHRQFKLTAEDSTGVPTGIARGPKEGSWIVADGWGDRLDLVRIPKENAASDKQPAKVDKPSKLKTPGDSKKDKKPAADDIPTESADIQRVKLPEKSYPYAVRPTRDGKRVYVSLWGQGAVAVIDPQDKLPVTTWRVGQSGVGPSTSHPTEMALSPDEKLLYVACANNSAVVVVDTATGKPVEQITSALYPGVPSGSTPTSLDLSTDGKVLLIANADNNNLAVIDVSHRGESRSLGFIPVGWYPTSARFSADGEKIYVANGKGMRPLANPEGPNPLAPKRKNVQYIGGLLKGTVSVIDAPAPADMAKYSQQARACSPLRDDLSVSTKAPVDGSAIPAKVGDSSPIKHCIYIIKENRTYDQIFGDQARGAGDSSLCIFGRKVTPNLHAITDQFVLLDNFYTDAEVSADGHEWSTAAYATDFVEKTWPLVYRHGPPVKKLDYPSEGLHPISQPTTGYIWDRCQEAGLTYRSYGEFIAQPLLPGQPRQASVKALEGHFDPDFHGWDLGYPDAKRTDRFIEELHGFEKSGAMPQFIVLRLPNDHTSGTSPGKLTPTAMVAENDLAVGRFVEAVSHSRFWPETAVFILEDDSQNGSDHIDAHRSEALVISPYCRRRVVDSTMYSTTSMLRTIELILGLKPMTQFDAAAAPMYGSFQAKPDLTPFDHVPAQSDLTAINKADAPGAKESAQMDFSHEDATDEMALNRVIWQSVRPSESMPPPVHAAFVRTGVTRVDDDD